MGRLNREGGFSLVEMLVVVGIIGILGVIGIGFSSKAYVRRDADRVANNISSDLNLMRMSAMRRGVEYRLELDYNQGCSTIGSVEYCNFVTLRQLRGDSNQSSSNWNSTPRPIIAEQFLTLSRKLEVKPGATFPMTITFRPNGTVAEAGTGDLSITVFPSTAMASADVNNCGFVSVNGIGRVMVYKGTWNGTGSVCNPIRD